MLQVHPSFTCHPGRRVDVTRDVSGEPRQQHQRHEVRSDWMRPSETSKLSCDLQRRAVLKVYVQKLVARGERLVLTWNTESFSWLVWPWKMPWSFSSLLCRLFGKGICGMHRRHWLFYCPWNETELCRCRSRHLQNAPAVLAVVFYEIWPKVFRLTILQESVVKEILQEATDTWIVSIPHRRVLICRRKLQSQTDCIYLLKTAFYWKLWTYSSNELGNWFAMWQTRLVCIEENKSLMPICVTVSQFDCVIALVKTIFTEQIVHNCDFNLISLPTYFE